MQCTVVPTLRMVVVVATSGGALAVTLFLKIVEGVGELAAPQLLALIGESITRRGSGDWFQTAIGRQFLQGGFYRLGVAIQQRI